MCLPCRSLLETVIAQEPDDSGQGLVLWGVRMRRAGTVKRSTGRRCGRRAPLPLARILS